MKALATVMLLLILGCGGNSVADSLVDLEIVSGGNARSSLKVEVADTQEELSEGLSGRPSLASDQGMLFVIEVRAQGFLMTDVEIPLTVAFISECGIIVDIQDMEPLSPEFHDTGEDYRFGLEVNQGWFAENAIGVGDRVVLPEELRPPQCR